MTEEQITATHAEVLIPLFCRLVVDVRIDTVCLRKDTTRTFLFTGNRKKKAPVKLPSGSPFVSSFVFSKLFILELDEREICGG